MGVVPRRKCVRASCAHARARGTLPPHPPPPTHLSSPPRPPAFVRAALYLAGPGQDVSLADFSFFPNLAYMVRLGYVLEGRLPNLHAYFQRMATRPSIVATWPPHWLGSKGLPILYGGT